MRLPAAPRTVIGGSDAVEVCAICDIAGCRHIRERAAAGVHAEERRLGLGDAASWDNPTIAAAPQGEAVPVAWGRFAALPAKLRRSADLVATRPTLADDRVEWITDVLRDAALKIEALERDAIHPAAPGTEALKAEAERLRNELVSAHTMGHHHTTLFGQPFLHWLDCERRAEKAEAERDQLAAQYTTACKTIEAIATERDAALARVAEVEAEVVALTAAQDTLAGLSAAALTPQPDTGLEAQPEFVRSIMQRLRRFQEVTEDVEGTEVDIGRNWLDLLTTLGLLDRIQRSPALWQLTDAAIAALRTSAPPPPSHRRRRAGL